MFKNKNNRKYAITTIAAAAAVASVAPVAASADTTKFPDVNEGEEGYGAVGDHYEHIMALAEQDIVNGDTNNGNKFMPWDNVVRGQVAKMITNALDLDIPEDSKNIEDALEKFDDVDASNDYAKYIAAVADAGIMGVFESEKGSFEEYKDMSREQMASTVVRAFDLDEIKTDEVVEVDLDHVSPTHRDAVQTLANLGITKKTPNFDAYNQMTRAAFSSFLNRTMEVVEENKFSSVTDTSTANTEEALGLVGSEVSSSDETIATADIEEDKIIITSKKPGETSITIKDNEGNQATIPVTVKENGKIELGEIDKYEEEVEQTVITAASSDDLNGEASITIDETEYTATVATENVEGNNEAKITFDNVDDESFDTDKLGDEFKMKMNDKVYTVVKDGDSWTITNHIKKMNLKYNENAKSLTVNFMLNHPLNMAITETDPDKIMGMYEDLTDAIAADDQEAVNDASKAIGDDVIMEYFTKDKEGNEEYLETTDENPLVKNKHWTGYLNDDQGSITNGEVPADENISTVTNPRTVVKEDWLKEADEVFVRITIINDGELEQKVESVEL